MIWTNDFRFYIPQINKLVIPITEQEVSNLEHEWVDLYYTFIIIFVDLRAPVFFSPLKKRLLLTILKQLITG